jgi:very-short-patch-repair endonuclease
MSHHSRPIILGQAVSPSKIELAKLLRTRMTYPEKLLWSKVRRNGLGGLHFRRQQIIAGFVVDFYCHEARLAVELDGSVHHGKESYDKARDQAIAKYDVEVLRIPNDMVTKSLDVALVQILQACQARLENLVTSDPPSQAVPPSQ